MPEQTDKRITVDDLKRLVESFTQEREWAQFHSLKNLSMAIAVEAAELMDHFKWRTDRQSVALLQHGSTKRVVAEELADVVIYCLALANRASVDLAEAVKRKISKNRRKYPRRMYQGRF